MSKVAVVTGASKGIGAAIAVALAEEGYDVVINYKSDEKSANEVAKKVAATGQKVLVVQADISSEESVEQMFNEIKKQFSNIDVLVNNAGIFDEKDGPDNLDAFKRIIEVNLLALVNVTNHARRLMKKGKIVNISSIHGRLGHGHVGAIAYSALKAALESYTKNLAKALAPDILVNAIAPGRTATPMWGYSEMEEKRKKELGDGQAIERWIKPEEIADGVIFLVKNDAVCGEILTIDGGISLRTLG